MNQTLTKKCSSSTPLISTGFSKPLSGTHKTASRSYSLLLIGSVLRNRTGTLAAWIRGTKRTIILASLNSLSRTQNSRVFAYPVSHASQYLERILGYA